MKRKNNATGRATTGQDSKIFAINEAYRAVIEEGRGKERQDRRKKRNSI